MKIYLAVLFSLALITTFNFFTPDATAGGGSSVRNGKKAETLPKGQASPSPEPSASPDPSPNKP
ncbi:MAG: hypothetical protein H7333_08260 [Bdellovibrionales bacterium]|nr:hypothetical protein [Oligoflexia bacterium]